MRRATLKSLLAHKLRMLLTAAAIVIGVSFVAATFVLTDTIDHTFETLFDELTAGTDVSVRGTDAFGEPEDGDGGDGGDDGDDETPPEKPADVNLTLVLEANAAVPG
ncbi:MAG TPA: hypothetical protein VM242_13710, partial [Acidimicrobiales bacterium]|nr:hypothetical protein [Acidimicrobiales bacterium]